MTTTATTVSGAGPGVGVSGVQGAPGAGGPAAGMAVGTSALVFLGVSVAGLVGLRLLLGEGGDRLPGLRIDAAEVAKVYLAYQTFNIPLKLVAYHWHGHKWAQTVLLFT